MQARSLAFGMLTLGLSIAPRALADGGTLRLTETAGAYRITVFTSPEPLRVGLIDVSILLEDNQSRRNVTKATVLVRLSPKNDPRQSRTIPATREAATNKLLYSAKATVSQAGWWHVVIDVDGPLGAASSHMTMPVSERPARWLTLWPWIVWPAFIILFFLVQQFVARKNTGTIQRKRQSRPTPPSVEEESPKDLR